MDMNLNYDVSHLCHLKSCVKISHLNHESRSTNLKRRQCDKDGECVGHDGLPDCLFLP